MSLLIKNGLVINPVKKTSEIADVYIEKGKIAAIGKSLAKRIIAPGAEVIDATGKVVAPGLVDMHVHLREPGFEAKETIETGTLAALKGGFTSVACMPNTNPVADNATVIEYILSRARKAGYARVYPIGAITRGSRGEELSEMADLKDAGAVAFSDDGRSVADAGVMRRAMQYASMLDMPIITHAEDLSLASDGVMHEGAVSTRLGLKGIPASAEEVIVVRDLILARETGCRIHIAHVSTAGTVSLIREAKEFGIQVTAEATPHHFTLTHEAVNGYNTATKVNPPLRTESDIDAIKEGLADGTIDVIATDHAPHTPEEKDVEYDLAPFGMVGLETAVGLVWSELVKPGILSPETAIAKMTVNPARILGINSGSLAVGLPADITIIDPDQQWEVRPGLFASKSRNTPFAGMVLTGKAIMTVIDGVKI